MLLLSSSPYKAKLYFARNKPRNWLPDPEDTRAGCTTSDKNVAKCVKFKSSRNTLSLLADKRSMAFASICIHLPGNLPFSLP
ncbi:hypothetical protein NPIL_600191 [Nephila pilipes]|uniref:Uncharacterized protein n=1 Tax=Nephila pilipes TaxID=299642 RepID=A0A8X6US34_NEPPI|nr:hypothetical protein NPIL_600191 [Nephila pilipes]